MYKKIFGLRDKPFLMTPDPAFLFLGKEHRQALDHLFYGIEYREGFILVTGDVGAGKTLLCRVLLKELNKRDTKTALILNPSLSEIELLKAIVEDLEIEGGKNSKKEIIDSLNRFLLKQHSHGKNVSVIIDEAQNLAPEVLEEIRLLSNLETEKTKLLQIILVGQPELGRLIDLPSLKQLKQRVAIRYHLGPLGRQETEKYIYHRLMVAGSNGQISFTPKALRLIYNYSGGIPRLINSISEKALLGGYVEQTLKIRAGLIKKAIESLQGKEKKEWFLPNIFSSAKIWVTVALISAFILGGILEGKITGSQGIRPLIPDALLFKENLSDEKKSSTRINISPPAAMSGQTGLIPGFSKWGIMRELYHGDCILESLTTLLMMWGYEEEELIEAVAAWKEEPLKDFSVWEKAKDYGLEATFFKTSLPQLKKMNYPGILKLKEKNDPDSFHWAVLIKVNEDRAIIASPRLGKIVCSLGDLGKMWQGAAIILWRDLDGITANLKRGARGKDVEMLQQRLKHIGYFRNTPVTGYYSGYTQRVIKDFQKKYKLTVDGMVGVKTRMALYRIFAGDSTPELL